MNDRTIDHYNIVAGTTIHIILRMYGGGDEPDVLAVLALDKDQGKDVEDDKDKAKGRGVGKRGPGKRMLGAAAAEEHWQRQRQQDRLVVVGCI